MYAVLDGLSGSLCAEFIKNNLFKFITDEPNFLTNTSQALRRAFSRADQAFLEYVQAKAARGNGLDKSGASAIVLVVIQDICYIASLGNCRAIMGGGMGSRSYNLYREHTLCEDNERKRVIRAGGNVQRSQYEALKHFGEPSSEATSQHQFRIYPGGLTLTRTFGHIDAKSKVFGGSPKVILSHPDVHYFKLTQEHDFILIGSSGTFQSLTNQELLRHFYSSVRGEGVQERLGTALSETLQQAVEKEAGENVSVLAVAFEGYLTN
jgi:protein phosphatase 2C family protein 2/3